MDHIAQLALDRYEKRDYRALRKDGTVDLSSFVGNPQVPLATRSSHRFLLLAQSETALLSKEERIGFMRSIKTIPDILSPKEREELSHDYLLFDGGIVTNISSDYEDVLNKGMTALLTEIAQQEKGATVKEMVELEAMKETIQAVEVIAEKYQKKAEEIGNKTLAVILKKIPYEKPASFHEALVFMRLLNFSLWLSGGKHCTLGRFDQYLYPFYEADVAKGKLSEEEAESLTAEFFISLNVDADLYPGVQQGDNGQSMVLGGMKRNGESAFNALTRIALLASLDVRLIDPKINLRVDKSTPMAWYELGTKLTKQGLGFPQYSNDDVVIPALVKWGYSLEDARDYVVAACWEFIIPGYGMDIPNIDALNFPEAVLDVVNSPLFEKAASYDELEKAVDKAIGSQVKKIVALSHKNFLIPNPFQSLLMKNCLATKRDIVEAGKYNNFGIHGAGIATAADSLMAIKDHIYDKKDLSKADLLKVLKDNFQGEEAIQNRLIASPKMGNNVDEVDAIGTRLLDAFADECAKYHNDRGGIYRPGTGTAMYYIWYSEHLGATPDGRKAGEAFSANFSPSLCRHFSGVLSVIKSFTKQHLIRVCNGGPLTLEFHDTLFRNAEGEEKVAMFVRSFIALGGHQLQLNSINLETLKDAQLHPERHKDLIVRVWGWSGYFNELDIVYQNHVMKRVEFE